MRSRASRTHTLKPASVSARSAAKPATPAPTIATSTARSVALMCPLPLTFGEIRAHGIDRVRLRGLFVGSIAFDARKPQCDTARIMRAFLHFVECDFDDELRSHVHDVAFPTHLAL